MPCWTTECVEINLAEAKSPEDMILAFCEVLNMTRKSFAFWYWDEKAGRIRIPKNRDLTPEQYAEIRQAYSKRIVARAARARGYKIRPIAENRWEVYR